jgi:hypothetical protein
LPPPGIAGEFPHVLLSRMVPRLLPEQPTPLLGCLGDLLRPGVFAVLQN